MINPILIPTKHYVGMVRRTYNEIPLGFITPWGEDAASKKRMDTVDSWVNNQRGRSDVITIEPQTIDNVPLSGFRLTKNIRNSGYGGYDKWRIEDPRGFELEITSGNIAQILSVGMVDKGEIIDQCVWAREGANNVLLSVATDEYKQAVENTIVAGKTASWKDVKLGDTVILQNNIRGTWFGRMYITHNTYSSSTDTSVTGNNEVIVHNAQAHIIKVDVETGTDRSYPNAHSELHFIISPKLSGIVHTDKVFEKSEIEIEVNKILNKKDTRQIRQSYTTVLALTFDKPKINFNKAFVTVNNVAELDNLVDYKKGTIYVESTNGNICKINRYSMSMFTTTAYSNEHLAINELRRIYNRYSYNYNMKVNEYNFDPTDKFFNLDVIITSPIGNEFSARIC
jgi:hypothetical protein